MTGLALGGFAVGMVEKMFPKLPSIPILGRKGTIAAAVWFMQPKEPLLQDLGLAAAAMAGYEFGLTGKVTGDDSDVFTTT